MESLLSQEFSLGKAAGVGSPIRVARPFDLFVGTRGRSSEGQVQLWEVLGCGGGQGRPNQGPGLLAVGCVPMEDGDQRPRTARANAAVAVHGRPWPSSIPVGSGLLPQRRTVVTALPCKCR